MAKKSFKDNNPALAFINTDDKINTQEEHEVQEAQEVQDTQKTQYAQDTQGRKGKKLPRINMAFNMDNLEFLRCISRLEGISITEYVNRLVEKDKEIKKSIVSEAKKLLKKV